MSNQEEIEKLRREVAVELAEFRGELNILREFSNKHFDLFTKHIADISCDVSDIFTYLFPMLEKTYPGYVDGQKQFREILKRSRKTDPPPDDKGSG